MDIKNSITNSFKYLGYIILYIFNVLTNWELLQRYLLTLLAIILCYFIFALIYCKVFSLSYQKFFEATIFPVVGLILVFVQGIIYIFFIPAKLWNIIRETFDHLIQIIKKIYEYIKRIINIFLHLEEHLLEDDINSFINSN
jgi:hypothetical protein